MSYATLAGFSVVCDLAGTATYYTPPTNREALDATFSLDVTHFYAAGAGAVVVTVEHKNLADTSWTTADTFPNITGTGVEALTVTDLKEEIRLKIAFSSGAPNDFVHMIVAAPTWLPE